MAIITTTKKRRTTRRRTRLTIPPEAQVQIAFISWLNLYYPEASGYVIKIDNEGVRSKVGHYLAGRMGLHKGASDIFLAWPTLRYAGLWLEIKREGWTCTASDKEHVDRQVAFINKMVGRGYHGALGVGLDSCIKIVHEYLK